MSQINFDTTLKKSESKIISQVFFYKLQRIKQYLSNKIGQNKEYHLLIQDLDSLITEAASYQVRVTIVGRQENLIKKVQLANQACEILNPVSQFTTISFPQNLDRLLKNCDLVFLVIDSMKNSIPIEKKLVIKAQALNIPLIIIDCNQFSPNIQSWLENPSLSRINYFNFSHEFIETSQLLLPDRQYDDFLKPLLAHISLKIEADLQKKLIKIVRKYFIQHKSQYLAEIKQQKQKYFLGKPPQEIKNTVKQSAAKFNQILQHNFRIIKQTLQESKQELINPFVSTSVIHHIHQVIYEAIAIQYRENKKIYLDLVIIKDRHSQTIHSHILELYQQKIDLWIDQQWNVLDQELNIFNQLAKKRDCELKILNRLSDIDMKLPIVPKPAFNLNKYICVATLSNINRTIFDYHYTQSTWFKMTIAIAVGLIFFLLTDKLFGFILVFVQIVNLLTGQSSKSLKLKQQTKELKKSVDNKYQNLVKFIADKLIQDLNIFLDRQCQSYQDRVNSYLQESDRNFINIKQKIRLNQNKISELNQEQEDIIRIIKK